MALFALVPAASRGRKASAQMGYWSAIFGNKHWPRFGKAAPFGRCAAILYRARSRKSAGRAPCTGRSELPPKSEILRPKDERNPKVELRRILLFAVQLGFRISLDLWISDFGLLRTSPFLALGHEFDHLATNRPSHFIWRLRAGDHQVSRIIGSQALKGIPLPTKLLQGQF